MPNELQTFIEQNSGKGFGDEYLFHKTILCTRYPRKTSPHTVEVFMSLPWEVTFQDCLDDREIRNNMEFYQWLVGSFFPLAKKRIGELQNA